MADQPAPVASDGMMPGIAGVGRFGRPMTDYLAVFAPALEAQMPLDLYTAFDAGRRLPDRLAHKGVGGFRLMARYVTGGPVGRLMDRAARGFRRRNSLMPGMGRGRLVAAMRNARDGIIVSAIDNDNAVVFIHFFLV